MSDSLDGLLDELRSAREIEYEPRIELVRITTHALQGSIVIMQMTDERARATQCHQGAKEALIHPEDWHAILVHAREEFSITGARGYCVVERIYGIRVVHDSSHPARFQGNGP